MTSKSDYHKQYAERNRERIKAYKKAYDIENHEKRLAYNREWNAANPEKRKANNASSRKNRSHVGNATLAKRRANKLMATPCWLTAEDFTTIKNYYEAAKVCEKYYYEIYHVDHIIPLQGKTVCGLHVPWNLQVLSGSENVRKSNKLHI